MRRYRLRSAYRHITGINISPPLPPFHLIQLRLNALLWRRLVPPSLRVARFALRQSARASSPARASSRRRTASPNPVTPSRRSTPDSPSSRITEALCAEASRDAKRRRARAAADPGAAEEGDPARPAAAREKAGGGGGGGTPRHPERRAGVSRARRARARAPLASPRATRRAPAADPPLGVPRCPDVRRGGDASWRRSTTPRVLLRRPDQSAGVVPGGCRSGTLETGLRLLLRPRPRFVAGLRFGLLDPDRAAARASRPDRA